MQHNFTGFVLVVMAERLPIEETARAAEILRESNVNVCGVVVNRVCCRRMPTATSTARGGNRKRSI